MSADSDNLLFSFECCYIRTVCCKCCSRRLYLLFSFECCSPTTGNGLTLNLDSLLAIFF